MDGKAKLLCQLCRADITCPNVARSSLPKTCQLGGDGILKAKQPARKLQGDAVTRCRECLEAIRGECVGQISPFERSGCIRQGIVRKPAPQRQSGGHWARRA